MKNSDKPICGVTTKQTGEPCQRVAGWGTPTEEGPCKYHKGTSPDGKSHEGNDNAVTHSAHRKPEFLKSDIVGTEHQDTFDAAHEALCSRYENFHGWIDYAIKKDLEEVALMYVKRDLIDIHASENAAEGSPLVETQIIGQDDNGRPVSVKQVNKLQSLYTDLRRESRLLLKDMGLYESPEKQQAEATSDLGSLVEKALEPDD